MTIQNPQHSNDKPPLRDCLVMTPNMKASPEKDSFFYLPRVSMCTPEGSFTSSHLEWKPSKKCDNLPSVNLHPSTHPIQTLHFVFCWKLIRFLTGVKLKFLTRGCYGHIHCICKGRQLCNVLQAFMKFLVLSGHWSPEIHPPVADQHHTANDF